MLVTVGWVFFLGFSIIVNEGIIGEYFNCNLLYLRGSGVGYFYLIIIVFDVLNIGMSFIVVFIHMGHFVNTANLNYNGCRKDVYKNVDADKWSFF